MLVERTMCWPPSGRPWTTGSSDLLQVFQVYIKHCLRQNNIFVYNYMQYNFTVVINTNLFQNIFESLVAFPLYCIFSVSHYKTYTSHIRVDVVQRNHKTVGYYAGTLMLKKSQELVLSFPRSRKMMCDVLVYTSC